MGDASLAGSCQVHETKTVESQGERNRSSGTSSSGQGGAVSGDSEEAARPSTIGPVPAFLDRTYAMVDEKDSAETVAWGALGDTFVIKRLDVCEEEVIPRFFNHRNLFSFVRQLNNHGKHATQGFATVGASCWYP